MILVFLSSSALLQRINRGFTRISLKVNNSRLHMCMFKDELNSTEVICAQSTSKQLVGHAESV